VRCTECEAGESIEPQFCECCGRRLPLPVAGPTTGSASEDHWSPVDVVADGPRRLAPWDDAGAPVSNTDVVATVAPGVREPLGPTGDGAAPSRGVTEADGAAPGARVNDVEEWASDELLQAWSDTDAVVVAGESGTPAAVPEPSPGSFEYLLACEGANALDGETARPTRVEPDQHPARSPAESHPALSVAPPPSDRPAPRARDEYDPEADLHVPAPWWAARSATAPASAAGTPAPGPHRSLGTPHGGPSAPTPPPPPVRPTLGAVTRGVGLATRRSPRATAPVAPGVPPSSRRTARPARRRFVAHAAVAAVSVTTVLLVGAPAMQQWSHAVPRASTGAPIARTSLADRTSPRAEPIAASTVGAPRTGQLWRTADHAAATTGPGKPLASTISPAAKAARAPRTARRASVAPPPSSPAPVARAESAEPLAATPIAMAAADPGAVAVPTAAPVPAAIAPPPTTTLNATNVDVRPDVVRRTEARSATLAAGSPEMVVLRVLVSASGSPASVRVLRGSKADPASDGAAIAAVQQWAFSPARKRGQAVDCWFNVAVPVHGAAQ
jgi:protein TonB